MLRQSPLLCTPSCARRLWRFIFPIIIEEVAEIVFNIPFGGEVGRFLCKLLDDLVAFPRDRIARIDLTPRPALKQRIDPKTGLARPDWKGIARELHVSRSTIGRRMPDLRDCGLVESVLIPVGPKVKITLYRLHE